VPAAPAPESAADSEAHWQAAAVHGPWPEERHGPVTVTAVAVTAVTVTAVTVTAVTVTAVMVTAVKVTAHI
jgi:hypothetical protein